MKLVTTVRFSIKRTWKPVCRKPPHPQRILPLTGSEVVDVSEGNDLSLLCPHTHSLHSELQIAFLRRVCWVLGTQRQEAGSEPLGRPGKKEVSPSHRSRKCTSTWLLNKEPVCVETALFDFYPQSHANCKQIE